MTDHYLALVFIGGGNCHAIRQLKTDAVCDVLREVQSSFGGIWNFDNKWIDVNLYDASKHENFIWNDEGVWGFDEDQTQKQCLFDAGLRLPTLEVQMPKFRKNGPVYGRSYTDKLVKAVHNSYEVADKLAKQSQKGKQVDALRGMLRF